jgi:hypothetical protein
MPKLLVSLAAVVAVLAVVPGAESRPAGTIQVCAHYSGHLYEACFAYIVNDSDLALRSFYADGRSYDSARAADVLEDFRYRYRGQARGLIANRAAAWPRGHNTVPVPSISITSASSSLVTDTAQLTTRETWRVTTSSGRVLYTDPGRLHHISMARVQGKVLHIWVVTAIR